MAEASLLKLELYRLIEKQKLREVIQRKLLACYVGVIILSGVAGVVQVIPWIASAFGVAAFMGLFFWGKRNLRKTRSEILENEQALKDVYYATDGSKLSTEDISAR